MPQWRSHPLYRPFYHEVGMLRADETNFGQKSIASYEAAGVPTTARFMAVEEVRQQWNGAFATSNLGNLSHILYNPAVGFAEADNALGAIVQAAVDAGVNYVVGDVDKLMIDQDGSCSGVSLTSGDTMSADRVLLSIGARTATMLARSAPNMRELHAGVRILATGAVSFKAKLKGLQKEKFAPIPVFKNCLPAVKGEGMSILGDGTIKFNCDLCFTNYKTFEPTGEKMSVAPEELEYNVWTSGKFIKFFEARARATMDGLYGDEVREVRIESYRMCWDASTPTHDFLITPHPHCPNLYLATGGSFHGWKFLPVIGDYVMDMMEGKLPKEYADRWAWDQPRTGESANPTYQIVGDLQDLVDGRVAGQRPPFE
ncbi:FAD dependent oxidoreductase domain-containing protein [Sarocladium implicatum]|nr:FAD dependent oxidoreductase domain-containing protein [Sarocladium implicatum]